MRLCKEPATWVEEGCTPAAELVAAGVPVSWLAAGENPLLSVAPTWHKVGKGSHICRKDLDQMSLRQSQLASSPRNLKGNFLYVQAVEEGVKCSTWLPRGAVEVAEEVGEAASA